MSELPRNFDLLAAGEDQIRQLSKDSIEARLVEVLRTWTKASLQFPPANFVYDLLLSGPPEVSSLRHAQ
jgi:hypothetical protein